MTRKESALRNAEDVMPPATAALFAETRENPLLDSFILIGGTALSLHIGHRVSEDLDFITHLPKLPRAALKELERELTANGHEITHVVHPEAYEDFQNAGLDLADSSQDWIVDRSVKLTFFVAEPQHAKLLTETESERGRTNGFGIAAFHELCRLKATVTAARSKSRDWLDLFILERDHHFGMAEWKDAFDCAGLTPMHFEIALNRMCHGSLSPDDEGYSSLLDTAPTVEEMQSKFGILRQAYETRLAKEKLGGKP
jgi:hypothetical protein